MSGESFEPNESSCPVRLNGGSNDNKRGCGGGGDGINSGAARKWEGSLTAKMQQGFAPAPIKEGCSVASVEAAAKHAQTPQPDQRLRLDTTRQMSSIPRAATSATAANRENSGSLPNLPHHQHDILATNWIYPSEQQMYNAMRKKGWNNVPEESIPMVLQIHNAVNEGTWAQICQWEGTDQLRLVKFEGRPRDLTPKAFFYSKILRINPVPFDRHDWYVAAPTTGPATDNEAPLQRYVIDYYMRDHSTDPNIPPLTQIDVRPALDGPRGLYLRGTRYFQQALPGISGYLQRRCAQHRQVQQQQHQKDP